MTFDAGSPASDKVAARLEALAPDLHRAIASHLGAPMAADDLLTKIDAFLANPPAGYYPPEKLLKTLERVRAQNVEGIVVFLDVRTHFGATLGRARAILRQVGTRPSAATAPTARVRDG